MHRLTRSNNSLGTRHRRSGCPRITETPVSGDDLRLPVRCGSNIWTPTWSLVVWLGPEFERRIGMNVTVIAV